MSAGAGLRLAIWTLAVAITAFPLVWLDLLMLYSLGYAGLPTEGLGGLLAGWFGRSDGIGALLGYVMMVPIMWPLHLLALAVWTFEMTNALQGAGEAGLPQGRMPAAVAWLVPGLNLVWPGQQLAATAQVLGTGPAGQALTWAWWVLADVASVIRWLFFGTVIVAYGGEGFPQAGLVLWLMAGAGLASGVLLVALLGWLTVAAGNRPVPAVQA